MSGDNRERTRPAPAQALTDNFHEKARQIRILCIFFIAGFFVLVALSTLARAAEGVTVHRGSYTEVEKSQPTVTEEAGVSVVRGPAVPLVGAADTTSYYPAIQQTPDFVPLRGFAGWFVDYKRNRFGNCFRLSTGEYLGYEILCTWRPLPG
ncbi:MAG: hypothetical protein AAF530_04315 [Pseudomonadota bacterium]